MKKPSSNEGFFTIAIKFSSLPQTASQVMANILICHPAVRLTQRIIKNDNR
jgi:hypothetical protein